MRDVYGDEIRLDVLTSVEQVNLRVEDTVSTVSKAGSACAVLDAKKARKLARKLLEAADELDAQSEDVERPPTLRSRVWAAERAIQRAEERISGIANEQTWDRAQITALLEDLGERRVREEEPKSAEPVDDSTHYLLASKWLAKEDRGGTDRAWSATFVLPKGITLDDRVSTGFVP